jgi:hypothetical protein
MMKTKTPIKVIKRGQRSRPVATPDEKKSTKETARDMVATVSEWVSEFQQKRRTETRQAIKSLFTETTPQTS